MNGTCSRDQIKPRHSTHCIIFFFHVKYKHKLNYIVRSQDSGYSGVGDWAGSTKGFGYWSYSVSSCGCWYVHFLKDRCTIYLWHMQSHMLVCVLYLNKFFFFRISDWGNALGLDVLCVHLDFKNSRTKYRITEMEEISV